MVQPECGKAKNQALFLFFFTRNGLIIGFTTLDPGRKVSRLLGLSLHLRQLLQIPGCLGPGESMVQWEPLGTLPSARAEEMRDGG